jgi:hypothetical protein
MTGVNARSRDAKRLGKRVFARSLGAILAAAAISKSASREARD